MRNLFPVMAIGLTSCAVMPKGAFSDFSVPAQPDYTAIENWAAHPAMNDSADLVPDSNLADRQQEAWVDVFFLHPTTYTGKKGHNRWNASVQDAALNLRTEKTTIRHQASIFNGAGRVFAPRYRQAHLESFYTKKRKADAEKALDLAYRDVRRAFRYYMVSENKGRPLIIAGHSQGALLAAKLLEEYFDQTGLTEKLVAAYLVGMPIREDMFENIPVCQTEEQIGCFCTWRTFKKGYYPKRWYVKEGGIAVTNPLTWTTGEEYAPKELNMGAVLQKFHKGIVPKLVDAMVRDGLLWANKPKIPFGFLYRTRNYHIADLNFYYMNVRENAQLRAKKYLNRSIE